MDNSLRHYLLSHEEEIAWGVEDFGLLRGAFNRLIEREPAGFSVEQSAQLAEAYERMKAREAMEG